MMLKSKLAVILLLAAFQLANFSCSKIDIVRIPKITSDSILVIKANSVIISAQVIDAGEGFDEYGHCWSKYQNPTILDSTTNFGSIRDAIKFESHINKLEPKTKYFIRHYFFDGKNYKYGNESYFTTLDIDTSLVSIFFISKISPNNNSIGISLDDTITIRFNKSLDLSTIKNSNIFISENSKYVNSIITYDESLNEIKLIPTSSLLPDTEYEIKVTEELKAFDGSYMSINTFHFSTQISSLLEITQVLPTANAIGISLDDTITINFNKPINLSTINNFNIYLRENSNSVNSTITYDETLYKVKIIPTSSLLFDTEYEIVITKNLKAIDGSSFLIATIFSFRTLNSINLDSINLDDGLIVYYPFDNNVLDNSGNNNHCIEYSNKVYVQGARGMAHDFNGTTDYLQLTNTLDNTQGLSFSFWVYLKGAIQGEFNGTIITKYNMAYDYHCFYVSTTNFSVSESINRLGCQFYNSQTNTNYRDDIRSHWLIYDSIPAQFNREKYTIVNPQYLPTNEWVHCIINMTPTEIQAWINGVLTVKKEREYNTYFNTNMEPTYIGNNPLAGFGSKNHLHGAIDELRVYNRELTIEEIQALFIN